jgi:hypothetical protein
MQQGGRGRGQGNGSVVPTAPGHGTVAPPAQRAYQSNLIKNSPTGLCATHAALTSKTGTRPSHAPQHGADPTTQKDSRGLTQTNTSTKGEIRAPN